jgi:hypothetical protein
MALESAIIYDSINTSLGDIILNVHPSHRADYLNLTFDVVRILNNPKLDFEAVKMVKSTMLAYIVLQCGYYYLSMFLTISQPPDLITEPATWHFNRGYIVQMGNPRRGGIDKTREEDRLLGYITLQCECPYLSMIPISCFY